MIQLASVYERDNKWYLHPSSRTVTGLWILTPPILELDAGDTREHKGGAVIEALAESRHGIPMPADGNKVADPLLVAAKARSWSALLKNAKSVHVQRETGRLTVMPSRKTDRTGTQEGIPDEAIELPEGASKEEIGAAVEEALSRCR